ncbi:MAG: hypothetical protein ACNI27_15145 [Desulfovibrio sp.]
MKTNIFFIVILLLSILLLAACASHPLGLSDAEWQAMSPAEKLEASKEQAKLDEQRQIRLAAERERRAKLEAEQAQKQYERDIASGMLLREDDVCLGGSKCPGEQKNMLILSLGDFAYIDKIIFYADDRVGRKHDGKISIFADRFKISENIDIKKSGQEHTIFVGRAARNIVIKAVNDDEVRFRYIKIFGDYIGTDPARIFISQ